MLVLPDALVKDLGAKYFLLIQAYGAKCAEIFLSIWTRDWAQVLSFTCNKTGKKIILINFKITTISILNKEKKSIIQLALFPHPFTYFQYGHFFL